jgi:hypothetical protein
LLFCYLSFVDNTVGTELVNVLEVTEWQRLAELCDMAGGDDVRGRNNGRLLGEVHGTGRIKIKGIIDGREGQLDIVT